MTKPRARRKREIGTIDCETDPFLHGRIPEPFLWGVYLGNEYHEFQDTPTCVDFISGLENTILYAHNGGKFDYHYLRDYIEADAKITCIAGRLAKFKIGKCELRDSLNIIPAPLARFDKTKIDYTKFEVAVRDKHMSEIRAYLRDDCRILYDIIQAYFDEYGQSLTQAGAAMRLWRDRFGGEFFRQQTAEEATLLRPYYFGGRVECFAVGEFEKPFVGIDRNSAYPNAMLSPHPISPRGLLLDRMPSDASLRASFVSLYCVSEGALPFREDDGSVSFPNDDLRRLYHATGHEIAAGLEYNALRKIEVVSAITHSQCCTFEAYVHHFFNKRKEFKAAGNKALDYFCKIFLNALYGKFGADPESYDEMLVSEERNTKFWGQRGYVGAGAWGERFLMARKLPDAQHNYYNVATAASITGQVRAEMYVALKQVVEPYYCDTDGIFAREIGSAEIGAELGQWKVEITGKRFAIAGKKTYAMESNTREEGLHDYRAKIPEGGTWKIACKGAKLTPQQIVSIANGHSFRYAPDVPTYSIHAPTPRFISRKISRTGVMK